VVCGNGKDYCLNGSCTDHQYSSSQDFAKAVSSLSAAIDAGKQLDQQQKTIFAGRPVECSEKPIGYSNCCTETGWGHDVGLDHCSDAEKKLHVDRDNKLAVKIGRYCSGSEPFPCLEHSQVFCVFSSKLAKTIQEQGRKGQLRINFGSAKRPNCRGITPEQLQTINFSRIDFKDFIEDLNKNVKNPDIKKIQELIKQRVEKGRPIGEVNG
jgi:conjugal transfer mating pair stabilization protein TraN